MASNRNSNSGNAVTDFIASNFSLILIILTVFVSGFALGSMWNESKIMGTKDKVVNVDTPQAQADPAQPVEENLENLPPVTDADHITGASDPVLTLVQYSDFMCPYCFRVHSTIKKVVEEYPNQVAWVYREFPMLSEQSKQGAVISECVAEYGGNDKYWEFIDNLLTQIHEEEVTPEVEGMLALVDEIGVDANSVRSCYESDEKSTVIDQKIAGGRSVGVKGVPATIIVTQDGQYEMVAGAATYESFVEKIEKYLD